MERLHIRHLRDGACDMAPLCRGSEQQDASGKQHLCNERRSSHPDRRKTRMTMNNSRKAKPAATPTHPIGTMRPLQSVPEGFSPSDVGFEEHLAACNFGGGNARLDFKTMRFDWACG